MKKRNILSLLMSLFLINSCSNTKDKKVINHLYLYDGNHISDISLNVSNEIVNIEGKHHVMSLSTLTSTLNQAVKKCFLIGYYEISDELKSFLNSYVKNYQGNATFLVSQLVEETIDQRFNSLIESRFKPYLDNLSYKDKKDLIMQLHARNFKESKTVNQYSITLDEDKINEGLTYINNNSQLNILKEDLDIYKIKDMYIFEGIKDNNFIYYSSKDNNFILKELLDDNIADIYTNYETKYNSIVEPLIDQKKNEVLGDKFGVYREYIYDFLYINNYPKIEGLSLLSERHIMRNMLYQLDLTDYKYSYIKYNSYDINRYYQAIIIDNEDNLYEMYGNSFNGEVMKLYKNKVNIDVKIDPEVRGFTFAAISDKTGRGKY